MKVLQLPPAKLALKSNVSHHSSLGWNSIQKIIGLCRQHLSFDQSLDRIANPILAIAPPIAWRNPQRTGGKGNFGKSLIKRLKLLRRDISDPNFALIGRKQRQRMIDPKRHMALRDARSVLRGIMTFVDRSIPDFLTRSLYVSRPLFTRGARTSA